MGKETNPSRFAVTLAIIVDTCQLLSFPLSKQFGLWSTRDPAAGIFLTALEYTNFSVLVSNQTAFSVVFFSLLVLTAGLVVNACYVGYCFARQEFTQFVTLRTLRIFSGLAKIGYVPALFVLLSAMRCSSELLDDTATCAAIRATTGLNLVGFVVLSCFFTSSMFDSNIRSMSPLARSDARSDLLQLLMRTVLVAQATLIRDVVVSLVTCGVASVLLILSFGFRLPYYDVPMMALKLASMAMLGWASIFTALQYVVQQADQDDHDSRSGLIWAFLLSAPFVCYAAKNFVSWRLERLTSSSIDVLSRPSEVLVKIRCTLREQIERSGRTGTGTSSAHTDSEDSEQDCIRLGGQLFEQACTKFPKSVSLWIARSTFMLFVCKNDHLTLRFVDIASRLDPYIDHAFLLYRIKRLLEDNVAEGGKALVNYLSSEKYLSDARAADIVCCQNLDDFWSELIRRHPSQARLMKLAERISTSSDVADQNYKKLMKLSNKSASLLMNYAGFLRDVLNDPIRSQSLLLEARTLQREKVDNEASAGGCGDTDLEGRLSDVGVIVVSDSGEVHSANSHFCRIFGYSKSHIVGRDINSIIPEPIKSVHQRLMARYLTTGQSSVIGTTRKLVGIDSQGFLVPILIRVKSFVHAAKELRYIGIFDSIYPREASGTQVLFGLEYESRFQYLSRDFARLLNLVNGFGNNGSDRLLDVPLHKVFAEYHDQSDRSERLDALEESEQQDKEAWRRKLLNSPLGLPVTFADTVPDCMLEALRPRDSLDRRDSFIAVGGNNSTSTGMRSLRAAKAWCVRLCVFGEEVHVWRIAHRDSRFLCKTPEGGHSNAQNLLAILDGLLPRSVTQNNEADDLALAEASLFGPSNLSEHTNKYADVSSVESDSEFSGAVNKHVLQKQHIVDVETDESQSLLPQSSSRSHSGMKDMSSCSDRTVEMTQLTRAVSNESAATVLVQSDEIDDDISSCCPKGRSVGLELPKVDSSNSPPLKPRAVSAVHVLDEGSASTGTTSGHSSARASSVVSATSYASTTTTVNTTYHIRKTLMANSSTRMHTYRKAFLLCVGVFSVIVITLMLVILSKLEHLVDGIVLLAQVRILSHFNVVAMTHDVTTLMLKSHNVLQQGDSGASMSAGTVDFTQNGWNTWEDSLVETAAAQHELLQQFEYEFKNYGNADAQRKAHHAVSTAVFSRFRDIEVDSLPLNLLTHQYLGFVREFLALNDSERRAYPPELNESLSLGTAPHASSTFLVVNVGPTAASETSPIISNLRKSEQKFAATLLEDTRSHASHLVLPLWIASGVLTFMLLFGPSLSLARQVSLTKKQVLCAFLEMPAKMCESLAMRAQMRLRHTHAQEEVIATSEDEFGGSNVISAPLSYMCQLYYLCA
ncbi:MAG: hypothetical protein MHM6MM_004896 [Cercozoa sp. M6MM]